MTRRLPPKASAGVEVEVQGEAINWWRFALSFLAPYCVSSYRAAKSELRSEEGDEGGD